MIKYDYEITVNGNQAKLNKDIYLFRGNKNVHYYFAVKNASFNFKGSTDLIEKTNAINAAVTVIKPNNVEVASAIAKVENGKIHLKVTEDLIDEEVEVGDFDLVFDLFDDTDGAVTIPKVIGQFHVLERPCTTPISELVATNTTNEVDQALTDYAIVTYAEPVASTNADGTFAKKTWVAKEKITTAELNRMEEGISDVSSQCKDIAKKKGLTTEQIKALNNMFKVCAYISDDVSTQYNAFKTAFGIITTNYTITNTLTNCTNNNSNTNIEDGSNYKATLIATTGYVLDTVTVTMGGTDITSATYSNGIITINDVTGNIIITANAIAKTLTSISATYTGGNVNVGTELTSLTGITVTATYSDNTTSIVNGYTLSGTIAEGSNTITVTYQGKTTTFTVTGVAINTDVSNETKWTNEVAYTYSPITGKYVDNKTGALIDYASYSATPYLYCKGASKIKIEVVYETTALATSTNHVYNAFYDENKTFISSFRILDSDYSVGTYKEINIPSNATYFVLSHKSDVFKNSGNNNMPVINVVPYR